MIDVNQESVVDTQTNEGEGTEEVVTLKKEEYAKLNEQLGSLKRDLKDLKKKTEETPQKTETKSDDYGLMQKAFLRSAQITDEDEVELALTTAKKWDMPVDKLVDDDDFKIKLEKHRTTKSNAKATSNVRGGGNTGGAKDTVEYWRSLNPKDGPPTHIPSDPKLQVAFMRSYLKDGESGRKFYNDPK